ncbi:hypothetical protein [Nocardioides hwasunensis]|uniref:Uncharacterized protein n=1 Tax=Nocardioides hwasunensis TaxID=397258 RepID=A0ABR8MIL0_9ACTN|nr:hypothetical protein [Nocardioides hwasunensis]MBD3914602.1 hypothetical protein [Nocardioides hwasunensis]
MATILALMILIAAASALVHYARHDRFAGPASTHRELDDLGLVEERHHLVPRA